MPRNLIRGDLVTLTLDAIDYTLDAKSVVVSGEEDGDATTFAGRAYKYVMTISAVQTDDEESLYTLFWDNPGQIIDWSLVPNGSTGRTFTGQVRLPDAKPTIGGDAFGTWTVDVEMDLIGEPVRSALPTVV